MGMARKYSSRKGSKIEPAVQTMTFKFDVPAQGGISSYIDLSQCASMLNRRFYRQGINWAVAGFKLASTPGQGFVTIAKLPNTWVLSNAWTKSFKAWQKMNNAALAENESVRPKFLDFKIYADAGHHTAGFTGNLLPYQTGPVAGPMTPGEWESSKIHVPYAGGGTPPGSVQELEMVAVGESFPGVSPITGANAVSLIEGYAASRALPNVVDPNVPGDNDDTSGTTPENWLSALFNEGTQQNAQVLTDMDLENNIAPYPFEGDGAHTDTMYPGGANYNSGLQIHDIEAVSNTTIGGTTRLKGGNFPCGLVNVVVTNTSNALQQYTMTIDLIPGNHRGYLCEPMGDM